MNQNQIKVTQLLVESACQTPYAIRLIGRNDAWLCANTANPSHWHYAGSSACAGTTSYATLEDASAALESLPNPYLHEVVEFVVSKRAPLCSKLH